jgi:hypothetical protein
VQTASCLHWTTCVQHDVLRHESHGVPPTPQPGGRVTSYPASTAPPLLDVEPLDEPVPEPLPELVDPLEVPPVPPPDPPPLPLEAPLLDPLEELLALFPEPLLPAAPELLAEPEPEEAPDPEELPLPELPLLDASSTPESVANGATASRSRCAHVGNNETDHDSGREPHGAILLPDES